MTMPVGSILELTVRQTLDSQEVLNVFHYQTGTSAVMAIDEATAGFWDYLKVSWRALVPSVLSFLSVSGRQLGGGLEYFEYPVPVGERFGTLTGTIGDIYPAFVAFSVKLIPSNRLVRPGSKRIAGVADVSVDSYGTLGSGVAALFNTFGSKLDDTIPLGLLGADGYLIPVILGKAHPSSPTGRPARASDVVVPIVNYACSQIVTTQKTRQRGRGA